jgi:hypothetical protein
MCVCVYVCVFGVRVWLSALHSLPLIQRCHPQRRVLMAASNQAAIHRRVCPCYAVRRRPKHLSSAWTAPVVPCGGVGRVCLIASGQDCRMLRGLGNNSSCAYTARYPFVDGRVSKRITLSTKMSSDRAFAHQLQRKKWQQGATLQ